MVHDKWSLQQGQESNSQPLGHESLPLPLDHGVLPGSAIIFQVRAFSQKTKFEINFKL